MTKLKIYFYFREIPPTHTLRGKKLPHIRRQGRKNFPATF